MEQFYIDAMGWKLSKKPPLVSQQAVVLLGCFTN